MPLIAFLAEAAVISLSGVMAPGPISAVAVGKGTDAPYAGALVAIGHGLVEMPLMIAVFYGLGTLLRLPYVKDVLALVGGAVLLWMAFGMYRALRSDSSAQEAVADVSRDRSPLTAGVLLSLGNPYFLLWWATVGAALIGRAVAFGAAGFAALALTHWLCDLGWDSALSALSYRGGRALGPRFRKGVLAISGLFLLIFGARFLVNGALGLFG